MDISAEILDVAFFVILLTWVLLDMVRDKTSNAYNHVRDNSIRSERKGFALFSVVSNAIICVSYLGFGLYEYWNSGVIVQRPVFSFATWFLATAVSLYSKNRATWPCVLIFWWVFSSALDLVSVSFFAIAHLRNPYGDLPGVVPRPNAVVLASFPLSALLCFNAFAYVKSKRNESDGLRQTLLDETVNENENENENESAGFNNAGLWSKVTFQWLNPLFKTGRVKKLELPHIPSVPHSETAENASVLLEESLRKQKFEEPSLAKAILSATWKSLAINAVFAGY